MEQGFVTEKGELTPDGLWESKLRIDTPLMVAQPIRENLLPYEDPDLLAVIMGVFVNEKEFRDDPLYQATLTKKLKENFLNLRQDLRLPIFLFSPVICFMPGHMTCPGMN